MTTETQKNEPAEGEVDSGEMQEMLDTLSSDLFPDSEAAGDVETDVQPATADGADKAATGEPAEKDVPKGPVDESKTEAKPAEPTAVGHKVPDTWRKEAAAEWAKLPPAVQAEVLKREGEIHRGLEANRFDSQIGKTVQSIFQPYAAAFNEARIDPLTTVGELLNFHMALSTAKPEGKIEIFKKLAGQYGVTLGDTPVGYNQEVEGLRSDLRGVKSKLDSQEQAQATAVRERLAKELEDFASKNEHFDAVAETIANLITSKQATSLQEAYDQAIWMNPAVRAKVLARQAAGKQAEERKTAKEKADKATAASSVNVKSKSKAASGATPLGTMDDTLAETLAAIEARGK